MTVIEIPVRWGDMDAYGHINNVQIVQLMEEARVMVFGIPPAPGTWMTPVPGRVSTCWREWKTV